MCKNDHVYKYNFRNVDWTILAWLSPTVRSRLHCGINVGTNKLPIHDLSCLLNHGALNTFGMSPVQLKENVGLASNGSASLSR